MKAATAAGYGETTLRVKQDSALVRGVGITSVFCRVLKQPEIKADSDYFRGMEEIPNAMEVLGELEEQTGQLVRVSGSICLQNCTKAGTAL